MFKTPAVAAGEAGRLRRTEGRTSGSDAGRAAGTGRRRAEESTGSRRPRCAGAHPGPAPLPPRAVPGGPPPPAAARCWTSRAAGRVRAVPGPASARRGGERARAGKRRREGSWPEEKRRRPRTRRMESSSYGARLIIRPGEARDRRARGEDPRRAARPPSACPALWFQRRSGEDTSQPAGAGTLPPPPGKPTGTLEGPDTAVRDKFRCRGRASRSIYTQGASAHRGQRVGTPREAPPPLHAVPPSCLAGLGALGPPTPAWVRRLLPGGGLG